MPRQNHKLLIISLKKFKHALKRVANFNSFQRAFFFCLISNTIIVLYILIKAKHSKLTHLNFNIKNVESIEVLHKLIRIRRFIKFYTKKMRY